MVSQLRVHHMDSNPTVDIAPNRDSAPPITFEDLDEDVRIPRLGSRNLIVLAEYLQRSGFRVDGFQLADAYMSAVGGLNAKQASKALSKALKKHGASRVRDLLATDWRPLVVTGIDFTTPTLDTLTIRRNGVIVGSELHHPETRIALETTLTEAWRQVQIR